MGAISSVNSDLLYITKQGKYFDADDFINFIKVIKDHCKNDKLALFLDNASIHATLKVK